MCGSRLGSPWYSRQNRGTSCDTKSTLLTKDNLDLVEMAMARLVWHVYPHRPRPGGHPVYDEFRIVVSPTLYIGMPDAETQVKRQLWHECPRAKNNSPSGDLKIMVMPRRPCYLSTKVSFGRPIAGVWVGTTLSLVDVSGGLSMLRREEKGPFRSGCCSSCYSLET